jgi:hypothetical protein
MSHLEAVTLFKPCPHRPSRPWPSGISRIVIELRLEFSLGFPLGADLVSGSAAVRKRTAAVPEFSLLLVKSFVHGGSWTTAVRTSPDAQASGE